jgi:hypothetical protein
MEGRMSNDGLRVPNYSEAGIGAPAASAVRFAPPVDPDDDERVGRDLIYVTRGGANRTAEAAGAPMPASE